MAKLKKTLPKNFRDLIVAQDWDTLKQELLQCEVNAYERGGIEHILFATAKDFGTHHLSTDMIQWILEQNNYDFSNEFWQKLFKFYLYGTEDVATVELILNAKKDLIRNKALSTFSYYNILTNPKLLACLLEYGAKVQLDDEPYSEPLYNMLSGADFMDSEKDGITLMNIIVVLDESENIFTAIKTLIANGANPKAPKIEERMLSIYHKFYKARSDNFFSTLALQERMEQFSSKLYELMQFEPQ
ncbi:MULTISPECIES: hypothetical protein [unclassified Moraxella]|uniref:hypothetical protein n=1 Tax=unclassified Moraxella TaxID=2685852 RepID=UPI003AF94F23